MPDTRRERLHSCLIDRDKPRGLYCAVGITRVTTVAPKKTCQQQKTEPAASSGGAINFCRTTAPSANRFNQGQHLSSQDEAHSLSTPFKQRCPPVHEGFGDLLTHPPILTRWL
ncbi:hypothetical protein MUG91_G120n67 [Manis pentadactyla]|nr:hypothetical protein MUG91_G120n67 [Manis pentadactyla]